MLQITASIVLYKNDPLQVVAAARSVLECGLRCSLVIVDNSPTDASRELVGELGAEYIFPGRNLGFGAAHNIALRNCLSRSEYHLVLNPDVRFHPYVLTRLYEFMQANVRVGMVMPRVLYPDGTEQHLCKLLPDPMDLIARRFSGRLRDTLFRSRIERYHLSGLEFSGPAVIPSLSGCFMLIRTSVLRTVGLFDEGYFMYMEDVDLCRRIGDQALTVFFPGVFIFHDYAKGSYRNSRLLRHHIASACRYFSKWGWIRDEARDRLNARISNVSEANLTFGG